MNKPDEIDMEMPEDTTVRTDPTTDDWEKIEAAANRVPTLDDKDLIISALTKLNAQFSSQVRFFQGQAKELRGVLEDNEFFECECCHEWKGLDDCAEGFDYRCGDCAEQTAADDGDAFFKGDR